MKDPCEQCDTKAEWDIKLKDWVSDNRNHYSEYVILPVELTKDESNAG